MFELAKIPKPALKEAQAMNPLFSADYNFARNYGGFAISSFLDTLTAEWGDCIIDSRLHMLKPEWYPAIQGWHLDDIPRDPDNGQPDLINPRYEAKHRMCIFDYGTGSMTEFVTTENTGYVPVSPAIGENLWETVDKHINKCPDLYDTEFVKDATVYDFGRNDYHRVSPAIGSGWRIFIRASINTERPTLNLIRRQTQVYINNPTKGW